ncbi:SDR family oxidoreductase [Rhodococcoides corynebacterioides]|uniref:SDR family oxidoreductase n=1 Tax=Rhodococcoides corynebacterioides TaxID=53972 RepID=UPI000836BF81|nr:SDR family oxidoreductase [Rhodococcus corynebacterioides]MBY6351627.1 SDR family oxidoreductase [Rhodococcus corynebacterioides]MBY6364725.1 SDR family oxidoreductase [Rhodococcus corynebacterioides]
MTTDLTGRVVAITGGARGIGHATAAAFLARGARVAIGDIDDVAVKEGAELLRPASDVHHDTLDVTDAESFDRFLDGVEATFGPIDVLINNAGIMPVGRVVDEPDAVTRRVLDINVLGVITGSKLAARRMLPRGRGHIVNIASAAGETYSPGLATYCASKFAVVGFTDAARLEHRGTGVEFSLVMPSFVNTELTAGTSGARGFRNAEPEEIARAVVSLIDKPRSRVRVTRLFGAAVVSQKFLPRPLAEAMSRALGADDVFLGSVDQGARRAYEERARHS